MIGLPELVRSGVGALRGGLDRRLHRATQAGQRFYQQQVRAPR